MEYRNLGKTELRASVIAFGTWGLGGGSVWEDTDQSLSVGSLLDAAADVGINYIDTAPVYGMGQSESLLGKALKTRRNRFLLQTKCSLNWREHGGSFKYARDGFTVYQNTSREAIRSDVEGSLQRLGTDHLDVLVVHYVSSSQPVEETVGALEDLKKEGKIRAYGISNSQSGDLEEYERYGDVALVQEQFSLLAPSHGRSYFPTCRKYGTTFQVYGALEEGFLAGPAAFADRHGANDIRTRLPWMREPYRSGIQKQYATLWKDLCATYRCSYANLFEAWTLSQYEKLSLLIGFRHQASIQDTVRALDIHLSQADIQLLERSVKGLQVETLDK